MNTHHNAVPRMGVQMSSREVMRRLVADGWRQVTCKGDHHQFTHPTKPGRVTVPHPSATLAKGTLRSIFRQAGLPWPP